MRRILIFPMLMVAVVAIGKAQEGNQNQGEVQETKKQVLALETERLKGFQNHDVNAVSHFYTDDLVYENDLGELLNKTQQLATIPSRKFHSFKHDDIHVNVYGNVAVVTGRSTTAVEYEGRLLSHPRRYMDIWVKRHGRWLMEAHSETPIAGRHVSSQE